MSCSTVYIFHLGVMKRATTKGWHFLKNGKDDRNKNEIKGSEHKLKHTNVNNEMKRQQEQKKQWMRESDSDALHLYALYIAQCIE